MRDKKERDRTGLLAVEGRKLCGELLKEHLPVTQVFYTPRAAERYPTLIEELKQTAEAVYSVTEEVYEKLTEEKQPEGIFAAAKKPPVYADIAETPGTGGFLILDGIQNPSNLGTVLRTAAALGMERILLGEGCADPFGKKALRAAMGAVFKVSLCITEHLCGELEKLNRLPGCLYAAALDENARDIRSVSFLPQDSIVIGNEGQGVSEKVLRQCHGTVIIPMLPHTESLNAAAAAAILIWEKQKGGLSP